MRYRIIQILTIIFLLGTPTDAAALPRNICNQTRSLVNPIESILVFISLNMPDKALQQLYREAKSSKIPSHLLLKELYQNSVKKTRDRIKKLGIRVIIHPELFEENATQNMPTFVFNKKRGLLILHGDLSLDSATAQAVKNIVHKY